MEEKQKKLSFKDVDFSRYSTEIQTIQKMAQDLRKDKKLMKKLMKYQESKKIFFPDIKYNASFSILEKESSFKKINEFKDCRAINKKKNDNISLDNEIISIVQIC